MEHLFSYLAANPLRIIATLSFLINLILLVFLFRANAKLSQLYVYFRVIWDDVKNNGQKLDELMMAAQTIIQDKNQNTQSGKDQNS